VSRVLVIGLLAAFLAGACRGSGERVLVKGFRFQPRAINVSPGTRVVWQQEDNTIHTITSGAPGRRSGLFDHRRFEQGDEFSFTFSSKGTFRYFCDIHKSMRGVVTVR
jgi:plastocyanin